MSVTEDTDVLTRVEQTGARRKSALEPCVISFFDGKDAEGKLVDFLPEQKTIVLRADGFEKMLQGFTTAEQVRAVCV